MILPSFSAIFCDFKDIFILILLRCNNNHSWLKRKTSPQWRHTFRWTKQTSSAKTYLQNILWESCSKFNFKQCSFKKFLKILIFWREYMEMCFHGNRISWGINHSFISLYSKYQPSSFICSSIMLAPVISSLDEIYCTLSLTLTQLQQIYCKVANQSNHLQFRRATLFFASMQLRLIHCKVVN